ncbi:putative bifunctional diguanylate cyclase/phosphodiesterase [Peristeroidobacter agariperforans]|uniref:putative bifunctional diguanylate cyclase/phosphodiesterase n=1 Tax=Peristeroidobacter agariperforans TaxID=268404 RepID=UPI001E646520|nr:bifunctional diguanylate cyclase/phosphodiesterase [Peristeroidobacter agariperforans]
MVSGSRTKLLIGFLSACTVLALTLAVAAKLFVSRFDAIENAQTLRKAEQLVQAVDADLSQLAISARDYAQWDQMYRYIQHPTQDFVDVNFTPYSLAGMEVDMVGILNARGELVFSAELLERQRRLRYPAPPDLLRLFLHLRDEPHDWRDRAPVERIVDTPRGPVAFSMIEINRSDKSDPTGAFLLFVRYFDPDEIMRIGQTSQLPAVMTRIGHAALERAELPADVRRWIATADAPPIFATNVDDEHAMSYALLRDMHGQPVAMLSAPSKRDIGTLGRRTTFMLIGAIALVLVACAGSLTCLVLRLKQSWRLQTEAEQRHRQTLDHVGEHDSLTALPNRVHLRKRLPELLQEAAAAGRPLTLLYVDLDHFKHINESRCHGIGDQLIKIVAQRVQAATRPADIVIRSGGDEFVVVAPTLNGMLEIRALASRLLTTLREPIPLHDATVSMTASIGVAVYPHDGADAEALLKHADIALYRAKELGRDNFQLFDAKMNTELSEHVAIEQALRRAIGSEQIYLEFQPLVDLQSGRLTSFEALARWRHPELGVVSPGRFIPVAEKSGLIVPLGEQILRRVIEQLAEWQRAAVPLVPVAVNVAPLQFERADFPARCHELALQHGLDPKWLSFEVTESAWLQNSTKSVAMIDTLRQAGSKVYLDDFGTGFSNLSYLKHLPIDAVKIDQAFVRNITVDPSDAAIVRGVLAMAKQLGIDTIAEGIETAEQLDCLREMGCHRGQGYHFSKPVPANQCRALLEQMGEMRRFTETMKARALERVADQVQAPAA